MEALQPIPGPAQRDRAIAGVATLLLLVGMPIGWLSGGASTGDVIGFIVAIAINLALMAAIVFGLVPRERAAGRAERTGLIVGIAALVLVLVFWTGLPFPLGAGAVALGVFARSAGPAGGGQSRATAAIVLGALAALLSFIGLLIG